MSELHFSNYKLQCLDSEFSIYPEDGSTPILVLKGQEVLQLSRLIQTELFGAMDQRRGFRVPIEQPSDLHVTIDSEMGVPQRVTPLDISFSGIQVEFPMDQTPNFPIDSRIKVRLEYHALSCRLDAEIARRMECKYGIHFPESIVDGELSPPETLFDIVSLLEQKWMTTKAV